MPFTVQFKFAIMEKVTAKNKNTNEFISAKVYSLCFNGKENLYYLCAPEYESEWISEESITKYNG